MLQYVDLDPCYAVAEAALGSDCHLMQHKAWTTGPGRPGNSDLHVDFLPLYCPDVAERLRVPIYLITAHYYLDDMGDDMALGPTLFVPGSHLAGRAPQPGEHSWRGVPPRAACVRAGDCLMFRSDVWHAALPNTTADRTRHLMQVHYCSSLISHRVGRPWDPARSGPEWAGSADDEETTAGSVPPVASPSTVAEVEARMNMRQRRLLAGFSAARHASPTTPTVAAGH